ncbi:hypothetical protein [Argonema antarcticum]|uniref:hypothetical protein n=1 Tax=Argonema antarcticum TaxID=2942763 RepID=UPI0020117BF2|nr:hypothetical protein [Argonema antarcticum]MCL1470805.1 hypothetical protein [Argonema antarcticum A004/B2]
MQTSHDPYSNNRKSSWKGSTSTRICDRLSAIAYSMDALIPGFYLWFGSLKIRIGGSEAEETYPGTIHSFAGMALVLPGYRIYSTYQGSYDP